MLAPHVRVWIGYIPDDLVSADSRGARCTAGTIIDGPYPPGSMIVPCQDGRGRWNTLTIWHVQPDGRELIYAAECLLHPIDDADEAEGVERSEGMTA